MSVIIDGIIRDLKDAISSIELSNVVLTLEDRKIISERINKIINSTEDIFYRLEKR